MSLTTVYDYDPGSDEVIVTKGVEGCEITWVGMSLDGDGTLDVIMKEGTLSADGKSIEVMTRDGQQETITGQEVQDFYTAHQAAFDEIIDACYAKWAEKRGKTGVVVK